MGRILASQSRCEEYEALQKLGRPKTRQARWGSSQRYARRRSKASRNSKEVVLGTRREIVQLERGKIKGEIAHAVIGDLPIHTASFSLGIRTKGGSHRDRIGVGLLAASSNHVVRSSYEFRPGDVMVLQPGCEHENRYYGGASMIIVMASEGDIELSYGTEARMCDPTCWRKSLTRVMAKMVTSVIPRLQSLLWLGSANLSLTAEATEFWKRAVIEAVTANVVAGMPSGARWPTSFCAEDRETGRGISGCAARAN